MEFRLYCIWDTAAKMGSKVFEATNDLIAWRVFEQANKGNDYAHESQLLWLGSIDKTTNKITPVEPTQIKPTDLELEETQT